MQIKPMKASRRKILPALNKPAYERIDEQRAKARSKPKSARTAKASKAGRQTLLHPSSAKRLASRRQTEIIEGKRIADSSIEADGEALKRGILGMADRIVLDEERYNKLMKMDETKLAEMYRGNDLIFDVYFDYGGITEDPATGAYVADSSKVADVDYLITQYEKTYGKLMRCADRGAVCMAAISRPITTASRLGSSNGLYRTARPRDTAAMSPASRMRSCARWICATI